MTKREDAIQKMVELLREYIPETDATLHDAAEKMLSIFEDLAE